MKNITARAIGLACRLSVLVIFCLGSWYAIADDLAQLDLSKMTKEQLG
jgi:hypothetical protein